MLSDEKLFFHKSVQHLARSLARIKNAPWQKVSEQRQHRKYRLTGVDAPRLLRIRSRVEVQLFQVNTLFSLCPTPGSNGVFRINNRDQGAIVALGIYFLESGLQHKDKILPYLLKVAKGLIKVVLLDEVRLHPTERIPIAEKFSFSVHTLLSDVAARCEEAREEIVSVQVECLIDLTSTIKNFREQNQKSSSQTKLYLCKTTVPVLIGLVRALGRFTLTDEPLICRIFPKPEPPIPQNVVQDKGYKRSFSNFRSIIPRSLSGNLAATVDILAITQGYDTVDVSRSFDTTKNQNKDTYDPKTYFFSKFGSSFNQFPHMRLSDSNENKVLLAQMHLQTVLAIAKKLLTKEMLGYLDEQALEVHSTGKIKVFPYKTFSETINLAMVTLLRELLRPQRELPVPFTKDVQEFVKGESIP